MSESHPSESVEYRRVPGFQGYRVGDDGSVWSCLNRGRPRLDNLAKTVPWRRLEFKSKFGSKGYLWVTLRKNKRRYDCLVHRLVLMAFIGPCPPKQETRHLDGIRNHNHLSNLCWGTRSENKCDQWLHGTHPHKLSDQQVQTIWKLYAAGGISHAKLAASYGVAASQIGKIIHRQTYRHVVV